MSDIKSGILEKLLLWNTPIPKITVLPGATFVTPVILLEDKQLSLNPRIFDGNVILPEKALFEKMLVGNEFTKGEEK